jgi:hypothetical protein
MLASVVLENLNYFSVPFERAEIFAIFRCKASRLFMSNSRFEILISRNFLEVNSPSVIVKITGILFIIFYSKSLSFFRMGS